VRRLPSGARAERGRSEQTFHFLRISDTLGSSEIVNILKLFIVNVREFFILSAILLVETFSGYGVFFGLQSVPAAEPEVKPDFFAVEVGLPPSPAKAGFGGQSPPEDRDGGPDPLPVSMPVPSPLPITIQNSELTPQGRLANPPEAIKAVYLTSWSAGSLRMIDYVINLARTTEMNAVVIDIKDFSGEVAYETNVPEVAQYGASRIKIWNIDTLLKKLHEEGLYVIARVTVFQDPVLVKARPDLAVQSIAQKGVWADFKGLGWIDPASQEAWNYTIQIARDASSRGFDEINFDYVRFPSDGDLRDMEFPFWDNQTPKRQTMAKFFAYMRENLLDVKISADLFGLSTSSGDDLGIGQVIEDAYEYFDYVYPMVYPSHYANGYRGYKKPAEYPYEVVHFSMASAQARLDALERANPEKRFARLRPWLQDFDLGAEYDTLMVQAQVQAAQDALGSEFVGFLLWAPTNYYTAEALNPFLFDRDSYNARLHTSTLLN